MIILVSAVLAICCARPPQSTAGSFSTEAAKVLVVENSNSEASKEIGDFYAHTRGIPRSNIVRIQTTKNDEIAFDDYAKQIHIPVATKLKSLGQVNYIVVTKGVPLRITEGGFSVDGHLMLANAEVDDLRKADENKNEGIPSPYFNKDEKFSRAGQGFFLVTRLDGYDVTDVKQLILNATQAKAEKGPFFFDTGASAGEGGYAEMHAMLVNASRVLRAKGVEAETDQTAEFKAPSQPVAGYASWGSNDQHFSADVLHRIRFKPGALAEMFVSTSGRTFQHVTGGQNLIADLVTQGITGVSGYVSEPFTTGLIHPDVLFERYTSGSNLAESFYMASPMLKWKLIVVGDPLCAPYAKLHR